MQVGSRQPRKARTDIYEKGAKPILRNHDPVS
jgi:hypothetical protein